MTIETTKIITEVDDKKISVSFSDSLSSNEVYRLARLPNQNNFLPYLIAGFFTDNQTYNRWFFSNARKHQEMIRAVGRKIDQNYQFYWGQLFFEPTKLIEGKLLINQISLESPPTQKTAFSLLMNAIDPGILNDPHVLDFF